MGCMHATEHVWESVSQRTASQAWLSPSTRVSGMQLSSAGLCSSKRFSLLHHFPTPAESSLCTLLTEDTPLTSQSDSPGFIYCRMCVRRQCGSVGRADSLKCSGVGRNPLHAGTHSRKMPVFLIKLFKKTVCRTRKLTKREKTGRSGPAAGKFCSRWRGEDHVGFGAKGWLVWRKGTRETRPTQPALSRRLSMAFCFLLPLSK